MKRKPSALTISFALLISVVTASSFVQFGEANWLIAPQEPPSAPILIINSVVGNETQSTSDVELDFTVYVEGWNKYFQANISWIGYSLDEKPYVWYVGSYGTPQTADNGLTYFHFSMKLTGLNNGIHSLTTTATYFGKYSPALYTVKHFSVIGYSEPNFFWTGINTIPDPEDPSWALWLDGTHTIPEFPSWTPLLIMLSAVIVIAFIYKRKFRTTNCERRWK